MTIKRILQVCLPDIKIAFYVVAGAFIAGFLFANFAHAEEIQPCPEPDPRDLVIGVKVDCLWDYVRSGLQTSYHSGSASPLLDICEKDRYAIKRFIGECK